MISQEGGTTPHELVGVTILKAETTYICFYRFLAYLVAPNVATDVWISQIKLVYYYSNHPGTSKNLTDSTEEK